MERPETVHVRLSHRPPCPGALPVAGTEGRRLPWGSLVVPHRPRLPPPGSGVVSTHRNVYPYVPRPRHRRSPRPERRAPTVVTVRLSLEFVSERKRSHKSRLQTLRKDVHTGTVPVHRSQTRRTLSPPVRAHPGAACGHHRRRTPRAPPGAGQSFRDITTGGPSGEKS